MKVNITDKNVQYKATFVQMMEILIRDIDKDEFHDMDEKESEKYANKYGWTGKELEHITRLGEKWMNINNELFEGMDDKEGARFIAKLISPRYPCMISPGSSTE